MATKLKSKKSATQLTLRGIPRSIDLAIRKKANSKQMSINSVILEILNKEFQAHSEPETYHDLDYLAGSMADDDQITEELKKQRIIHPGDWV